MEEGLVSDHPDWTSLPPLALQLISEKFKLITDYVRFRAVCSPWRLASPTKPRHLPVQLPWLMIPCGYVTNIRNVKELKNCPDDGVRLFYDPWESKMRTIHLPETIGKCCCASYSGWLLIVADKGSELFLLNPLTRDRVSLPPFTTPVRNIWNEEEDMVDMLFKTCLGTYLGGPYFIRKVTFSSYLTDPDCIIMVFFDSYKGVFFCRVGDCRWTMVGRLADAAYHNGNFYLIYAVYPHRETMHVYDLSKHSLREGGAYVFKPELHKKSKYFLLGMSELYLISSNIIYQGEGYEPKFINQGVVMMKIQDSTSFV